MYLLKNYRYSDNGNSTMGNMFTEGKFECFTLEDEYRKIHQKVKGETRITAGLYDLKLRTEDSPLNTKYKKRFPDFFKGHLWIKDVPNMTYCYIHIGNDEGDTDACICVGDSAKNNQQERGYIGFSTNAYKRLYIKVSKRIIDHDDVKIAIIDDFMYL